VNPISRTTDPATSHLAAEAITVSGRRESQVKLCAAAVKEHPGATAYEVGEFHGLGHWCATKRLSDAFRWGLVDKGVPRLNEATGRQQTTWWPIEEGGGRSPE